MNLGQIINKIKTDPKYSQTNSVQWFKNKVTQLGTLNTLAFTKNATFTQVYLGTMVLYNYDPKLKNTLPYYDMFPLVLPFTVDKEGFTGLNLHYLDYKTRIILLYKLKEFEVVKTISNEKRMLLQWNLIKNIAGVPRVKHCVKRYLRPHVRSRFLKIPFDDWLIASQLPISKFIGDKETNIWRQK